MNALEAENARLKAQLREKDAEIAKLRNALEETSSDIIEAPVSEFQNILEDLVSVYNLIAETVRNAGILRGRELAKVVTRATDGIKSAKSPTEKMLLLNAYIKQLLTKIREALKSRPAEGERVIQVISKIQARALQIIDYIKTYADDPMKRKEIALDSQQTRLLFSGKSGEPVSRRDTIRAMRRAERLWPALQCGHRPNDGRQTMRLTAKTEDLTNSPEFGFRDLRQRFGLPTPKIMFNLP